MREQSKSVRWDYPTRWWGKLSENQSGSSPLCLPALRYAPPPLPGWKYISRAHRLSLYEFKWFQTLCLYLLVCMCMFVHICPFDQCVCLFVFASVNVCPGGVCVFVCVCQSEAVIPLMGMTDGKGVAQLVLSATWEAGGGVCVPVQRPCSPHQFDRHHFVSIHVRASQIGRLIADGKFPHAAHQKSECTITGVRSCFGLCCFMCKTFICNVSLPSLWLQMAAISANQVVLLWKHICTEKSVMSSCRSTNVHTSENPTYMWCEPEPQTSWSNFL